MNQLESRNQQASPHLAASAVETVDNIFAAKSTFFARPRLEPRAASA
jgi:hypothetical protein